MIIFNTAKTKITKDVDEAMKQMHALDVRLDTVHRFMGSAMIPYEGKTAQAVTTPLRTLQDVRGVYYFLEPGVYSFDTLHVVDMAEGEAGWLIPRSSLTRNGVDVRSALYDAGYKGGINGIFVVHNQYGIKIYKGARVAQFVIVKAETARLYEGQYQKESK